MNQRLSFLTIGVRDLAAMTAFYNNVMGWQPMKVLDDVVFYKLNGFVFALFPTQELAKDIGIDNDGSGFKGFSLAMNLRSESEVDQLCQTLKEAGVTISKPPQKTFWGGYHFYFSDPESNHWEVAYNPFLELDTQGNVLSHQ